MNLHKVELVQKLSEGDDESVNRLYRSLIGKHFWNDSIYQLHPDVNKHN